MLVYDSARHEDDGGDTRVNTPASENTLVSYLFVELVRLVDRCVLEVEATGKLFDPRMTSLNIFIG